MKRLFLIIIIGHFLTSCNKSKEVTGCTYHEATNYNPDATIDDGTCDFYVKPDVFISGAIPGEDGAIILGTNLETIIELSYWTIGYYGNEEAFTIPNGTGIEPGVITMFSTSDIGFVIAEEDFVIYLKDSFGNLVHTWDN